MEKMLLASIQIYDDVLGQLAFPKARVIKDVILRSQKIEPERTFLIGPSHLCRNKRIS